MNQLIVIVKKLNKRSSVPASLSDKGNIIGTVNKGFRFEGIEFTDVPNPALGKWYVDRDNHFYWGGGLMALNITPASQIINIQNLPLHLPSGFRAGIDISHHNTINDWAAFKNAGITFTYIKISEGVGTPDAKAKRNAEDAKEAGFKIGYYHFCRPDTRNGNSVVNDAAAEADDALQRMSQLPAPDLPLALDLERWTTTQGSPLKPADYLIWVNAFIDQIKEKSGFETLLYATKDYLDTHLPHSHNLGSQKLWIAHYGLRDANSLKCPTGWNDWAIWQYTADGTIGNNGKLDINILKDLTLF